MKLRVAAHFHKPEAMNAFPDQGGVAFIQMALDFARENDFEWKAQLLDNNLTQIVLGDSFHICRVSLTSNGAEKSCGYSLADSEILATEVAIAEAIERATLRRLTPLPGPAALKSIHSHADAFRNSNGFAAHRTLLRARNAARKEIFERHCSMSWWIKRLPAIQVARDHVMDEPIKLCLERFEEAASCSASHFLISQGCGLFASICVFRSNQGRHLSVFSGAGATVQESLENSAREGIRSLLFHLSNVGKFGAASKDSDHAFRLQDSTLDELETRIDRQMPEREELNQLELLESLFSYQDCSVATASGLIPVVNASHQSAVHLAIGDKEQFLLCQRLNVGFDLPLHPF